MRLTTDNFEKWSMNLAFVALAILTFVPRSSAFAQRVIDDVNRFSSNECKWIYSQYLDECLNAIECPSNVEEIEFSMSTQRGMYSMERAISVRAKNEIDQTCLSTCRSKSKPTYKTFESSICSALMKKR